MDRSRVLAILEPMMAGFKRDLAKMRAAGATQADIDAMLHEFEKTYASDDNPEGKLVMAVLGQAAEEREPEKN